LRFALALARARKRQSFSSLVLSSIFGDEFLAELDAAR
jgi:hypothetical protein